MLLIAAGCVNYRVAPCAEPAVAVIVKVRSTDAPDLDLHPHVVSTERLVRHLLVAQIVGSVDDYGFHWA